MTSPPSSLLRFFPKEEFARQFVGGEIWFGILEYYRGIEDSRRDDSEGQSSVYYKVSGNYVHSTVSSLNRYYILCTSHPEVSISSIARKYGQFMVRINSPLVLLERIKLAWQTHDLAIDRGAFMTPVEYTKHELRDADPNLLSPPPLAYCQKPRSYEEDREHRYFLKCEVDLKRAWESHLILTLPDCADICSAVTIRTESQKVFGG